MEYSEIKCPYCKSKQVRKHGKYENGDRRYRCENEDCTAKTFKLEYRYNGCNPGIDAQIISMAANASGVRDTARVLGITTDKVMSTLKNERFNKSY